MTAAVIPFTPRTNPRCANCRYWARFIENRGRGFCELIDWCLSDPETNSDYLCDRHEYDREAGHAA